VVTGVNVVVFDGAAERGSRRAVPAPAAARAATTSAAATAASILGASAERRGSRNVMA
jgi:hypothetical protein